MGQGSAHPTGRVNSVNVPVVRFRHRLTHKVISLQDNQGWRILRGYAELTIVRTPPSSVRVVKSTIPIYGAVDLRNQEDR